MFFIILFFNQSWWPLYLVFLNLDSLKAAFSTCIISIYFNVSPFSEFTLPFFAFLFALSFSLPSMFFYFIFSFFAVFFFLQTRCAFFYFTKPAALTFSLFLAFTSFSLDISYLLLIQLGLSFFLSFSLSLSLSLSSSFLLATWVTLFISTLKQIFFCFF